MEQGMAQDLFAMEVASELNSLDIVYGIVTNYATFESKVVTVESLQRVAGKIYNMVSD